MKDFLLDKQNRENIDIFINLFMLCPDKRLSDFVTSFKIYFHKFESPKTTALVQFIESSTFTKENKENFIIIKDTAWDKSNQRIFFAIESGSLSKTQLKYKI